MFLKIWIINFWIVSFEIPVSTAEKPKRVNKSRISTSTQTTKRSPKIHEYPHSFNNEIINENIRQRIQLKLKTKSRFTNRNISKYTRVWESNNLGIPKVKINYDTLMNKIMKVKSDHGTSHWNFDGAQKLVLVVFIKLNSLFSSLNILIFDSINIQYFLAFRFKISSFLSTFTFEF